MKIQDFRDLEVWQVAMDLVTLTYQHMTRFPSEERYGLTSQVRRAAVSIPYYLSMARGSVMELRTQAEIAKRLTLLNDEQETQLRERAIRVAQMINALMNALEKRLQER